MNCVLKFKVLSAILISVLWCSLNAEEQFQNFTFQDFRTKIDSLMDTTISYKPETALKYAFKMLEKARKEDNRKEEINAYVYIARAYQHVGEFLIAIEYAIMALQDIEDRIDEYDYDFLRNVGNLYTTLNNVPRAMEYYELALSKLPEDNYVERAKIYRILGRLYKQEKEFDTSINLFNKALHYYDKVNSEDDKAILMIEFSTVYMDLEQFETVNSLNFKALNIIESGPPSYKKSRAYNNLGWSYYKLGDFEASLKYNEKALEVRQMINQKSGIASSLRNIGILYYNWEKYKKAEKYLLEAENIIKTAVAIGDKKLLSRTYENLYSLYKKIDKPNLALSYLEKHLNQEEVINSIRDNDEILQMQLINEVNMLKNKNKIQKLENRRKYLIIVILVLFAAVVTLLIIIYYTKYLKKLKLSEKLQNSVKSITKQSEQNEAQLKKEIESRHKVQAALTDFEARFTTLIESIHDGVLLVKDNKIVMCNQTFSDIISIDSLEIAGADLYQTLDFVSQDEIDNIMKNSLNAHFETEVKTHSGKIITLEISSTLLEEDEICLYLTVVRDITEKKRIQGDKNRISNLESLGALAGGIAHDFNNLLSIIMGNISFAKMIKDETQIHNLLKNSEDAVKRASNLANRLLTFSKGGTPKKQKVMLHKLLTDTCSLIFGELSIKCNIDYDPDVFDLYADEEQISQVFQNLLVNAKEAVGIDGNVNILVENEPGYNNGDVIKDCLKITIEDNGKGISKSILPKVFDPYFTTKEVSSEKGTGLGLSIVHSVISKHDGVIEIVSEEDRGTKVTVHLPTGKQQ